MAETEAKPLSRSEREALIKDKAGWVIVVFAALLAINTYMAGGNSSKVLNNTIEANNTYAFYQAKSIKGTLAEMALDDAIARKDTKKAEMLEKKIARYESDPATGEGKKELLAKAKAHEHERDHAMRQDPWFDYAEGMLQIAIVLLSVSIIGGVGAFYWVGSVLGVLGFFSMLNGFFLWF